MTQPIMDRKMLPDGNAQFIAYGHAVRDAHPVSNAIHSIRPQVYVRYYQDIGVKEVKRGGRSGTADTVAVHFDPESVGLREAITAYLDTDDPLADYIEQACNEGRAVSVGIETVRRVKTKSDRAPISKWVPIHALRGAVSADGASGPNMQSTSGENIRNVVALVDGRASNLLTSDPSEWASLVDNKGGNIPPEGWAFLGDGQEWSDIGVIIPMDGGSAQQASAPGQGASFDPDALRALLTEVITQVMDDRAAGETTEVGGRPVRRGRFSEGKPWDVRTSDGRMNLGGYVVTAEGWGFRWAHNYLREHHATEEVPSPAIDSADAWNLANLVTNIADEVQSMAYAAMLDGSAGATVPVDRSSVSHREATRWVEWVIEQVMPYPDDSDAEDEEKANEIVSSWAQAVRDEAVGYFSMAGRRAGEHYGQRAQQERAQREQRPSAPQGGPTPEGPSGVVVKAFLDSVVRAWGNQETIANMGKQITERQMDNVRVRVEVDGNTLSIVPVDNQEAMTIRQVLQKRYGQLSQEQPAAQEQAAAKEQPESAQQPQQDPNRGYSAEVAETIRGIVAATDLNTLRSAYETARQRDVLTSVVGVMVREDGGLIFGAYREEGYEPKPLAEVIEHMRAMFERDAASQQPEAAQEPQQESEPEASPQSETTQDEAPEEESEASEPAEENAPETEGTDEPEAEGTTDQDESEQAPADQGEEQAPQAASDPLTERAQEYAVRAADASDLDTLNGVIEELDKEPDAKELRSATISMSTGAGQARKGNLQAWLRKRTRDLSKGQK